MSLTPSADKWSHWVWVVLAVVAIISWTFIHHPMGVAQEPMQGEPAHLPYHAQTPMSPPMIIWYHNTQGYSMESLQLALSSGLVSHVMVMHRHRLDAPLEQADAAREAIEWIHAAGKKVIWTRSLWPYTPQESVHTQTLFDPNYYVAEIESLRREARELGADYVALDTEPYAESVMRTPLKSEDPWDVSLRTALSGVIQQVMDRVGEVDFILPGGSLRPDHPYNILARMGSYRISENTYYAHDDTIDAIRYPYEIFGAYVSTARKHLEEENLTYYLVEDVFEQSQRWSTRRGVLLYTDRSQVNAIARDLHVYVATLHQRAEADRRALAEESD